MQPEGNSLHPGAGAAAPHGRPEPEPVIERQVTSDTRNGAPRRPRAGKRSYSARVLGLYLLYLIVILGAGASAAGWLLARQIQQVARTYLTVEGSWFTQFEPGTGLQLAKGASTHYREPRRRLDFHIYTDPRGLRVSRPDELVPERVDVLVVGASFVFGWGVEAERALPARLAEMTGLRVANAAIPASGTLAAVHATERYAGLEPRFVLYGLTEMHLSRNLCPCSASLSPFCQSQPYLEPDGQGGFVERAAIQNVLAPADGTRRAYETIVRDRAPLLGPLWGLRGGLGLLYRSFALRCPDDPDLARSGLDFALERLTRATQQVGAELIVLHVPRLKNRRWASPSPLPLEALGARQDSFTLIDLQPLVVAYYAGEERWQGLSLPVDGHPGPAGYELMARTVCDFLQKRGALAPDTVCPTS